jgi:hypothetical protein
MLSSSIDKSNRWHEQAAVNHAWLFNAVAAVQVKQLSGRDGSPKHWRLWMHLWVTTHPRMMAKQTISRSSHRGRV